MEKTQNYNLNKPEPNDPLRVADFNENSNLIDTALAELAAGMPKIACGIYTGNGAASRTIELGFTPKAVLVCDQAGHFACDVTYLAAKYYYGGLAVEGYPVVTSGNVAVVTVVEGGFTVAYKVSGDYHYYTNCKNTVYHYVAIG